MVIFRNDTLNHRVNWEAVTVLKQESHYWKRRSLEVIHIQTSGQTTNLDCGLSQESTWLWFLNPDTWLPYPPFFRIQTSIFHYLIVHQWLLLFIFGSLLYVSSVHESSQNEHPESRTYTPWLWSAAMSLYNTELITALASLRLVITCNRWQCYQVKQDIVL